MNKKRFQFDGIRFLAFLKVFLNHLPLATLPFFHVLQSTGTNRIFFLLSGFLITFIILNEKVNYNAFDFKTFITKRILRLTPLYYLIIAFAFLTPVILNFLHLPYSDNGYEPELKWSLTFLENYKMMVERDSANVSPLSVVWSLCIEVHFYLLWGLTFLLLKPKHTPYLIALALIIAPVARYMYHTRQLVPADLASNLDYFAYGALPAYLYIMRNERFEEWIEAIPDAVKNTVYLIAVLFVFAVPKFVFPYKNILEPLCFGLLFMLVITFLAGVKSKASGKTTLLSYLGTFTYGMYLYHTIVINLFIKLFTMAGIDLDIPFNTFCMALMSLLVTILISIASYHLFEKHFLLLGKKTAKADTLAYNKK
jgi:peptidoglycan/LPS O-acetylase OafA/YrhL